MAENCWQIGFSSPMHLQQKDSTNNKAKRLCIGFHIVRLPSSTLPRLIYCSDPRFIVMSKVSICVCVHKKNVSQLSDLETQLPTTCTQNPNITLYTYTWRTQNNLWWLDWKRIECLDTFSLTRVTLESESAAPEPKSRIWLETRDIRLRLKYSNWVFNLLSIHE